MSENQKKYEKENNMIVKSIKRINDKSEHNNKLLKGYMEINNMNEIKRKMNERISDSMAFKNMKGLKENLKNAESINAYYIYMHDMDKTNARLEERRNKAKKIIDKVELLCEDEVNKKEYLKNKKKKN